MSAEFAAVLTVVNPLTASIMGIVVSGEGMNTVKLIGYVFIFLL